MAHQWDRGVLAASSWHGLEDIGTFTGLADIMAHGLNSGAWPIGTAREALRTATGLRATTHDAIVATYADHPSRVVGVVGGRYRATNPEEWRSLVAAACEAGATPTGAFSLQGGSRVLATFDVGNSNGIRNQFCLADSFDGSLQLTPIFSSVRVVCANTLSAALASGDVTGRLRHTKTMGDKIATLREGIAESIVTGEAIRTTVRKAEETRLATKEAEAVFDALFPRPADDASPTVTARRFNARRDGMAAAINPVNNAGPTLASLWNAATYLVDRNVDGSSRDCRGGADRLNALLFGERQKRIAEVQYVIETVLRDGTVALMAPRDVVAEGVDPRQVGARVLEDMLE